MTLFSSSRSKILPTDAMRCPWRPHVSAARRRSHCTAWSSRRSPLEWSCGGSWMDGCCECLVSVPPTPNLGGRARELEGIFLDPVVVHPPALASLLLMAPGGPGAHCSLHPSLQRPLLKGPPPTLSTPGRPIGSGFPQGTLGNSWRHCHHQGGGCRYSTQLPTAHRWPRTQRDRPKHQQCLG